MQKMKKNPNIHLISINWGCKKSLLKKTRLKPHWKPIEMNLSPDRCSQTFLEFSACHEGRIISINEVVGFFIFF